MTTIDTKAERAAYIEECQRRVDRSREEMMLAEAEQAEFQQRLHIFIALIQIETSLTLARLWGNTFR